MKNNMVWVNIEQRRFIVSFDENGEPKHIRERCMYQTGPQKGLFYDNTFWNAAHHGKPTGRCGGLGARILKVAVEKQSGSQNIA